MILSDHRTTVMEKPRCWYDRLGRIEDQRKKTTAERFRSTSSHRLLSSHHSSRAASELVGRNLEERVVTGSDGSELRDGLRQQMFGKKLRDRDLCG